MREPVAELLDGLEPNLNPSMKAGSSVTYLRHCLTPQRVTRRSFTQMTISDLDPKWGRAYIAILDGRPILRRDWSIMIYDGHTLVFIDSRSIPQGGGGSNPLQMVALLAVIIASVYTGGAAAAAYAAAYGGTGAVMGGIVSGVVMMAGSMLVNALIPAATTSLSNNQQVQAADPTYSIQAQGNYARLEGAIPEHFGRHICFPDFGAAPYQEFFENSQILYQLFCVGRGFYALEEIHINDTPISGFDNIEVEIIPPGAQLTLFPANVITSSDITGEELPVPIVTSTTTGSWPNQVTTSTSEMIRIGPFVMDAGDEDITSLGFDFLCQLYYREADGRLTPINATVGMRWRPVDEDGFFLGDGEWITRFEVFTNSTLTPLRYSVRHNVPPGKYEVEVWRVGQLVTNGQGANTASWIGLRGYTQSPIGKFGDCTLIAIKAEATQQISAMASRQVNVVATRMLPIWDGLAWSPLTATTSIAWTMAYMCKQAELPDSQIDLDSLLALDAIWAARGDECNGRFDNFLPFWEALTKVASAGRCKPFFQAGVVRFFRDQLATLPVTLFAMHNIVKGSFAVDYVMPTSTTADAVNVGYFDERNWRQRRVKAFLPGSLQKKVAKMETNFITNKEQAYREGMNQMASNLLRRKILSFSTEMDGYIPTYGDLIAVQHDMPGWGQGFEVVSYDPASKVMVLSEPPKWSTEPGQHYVGLRRRNASMNGPLAVEQGAEENEIILTDAPDFTPYTGGAQDRTKAVFGWGATWSQLAKVLSVKPKGRNRVEIQAVNEDAAVHGMDEGVFAPATETSQLPAFTSKPTITGLNIVADPEDAFTMIISWNSSPWADSYIFAQSGDGGLTWTPPIKTTATSLNEKALFGGSTKIRVAAVGVIKGPFVTADYGIENFDSAIAAAWDADQALLTSSVIRNVVKLQWKHVGQHDGGYEVRVGADWETGEMIATGLQSSFVFHDPQTPGSLGFWLKAIISANTYSVGTANCNVDIISPSATNLESSVTNTNVMLSWTSNQGTYPIKHALISKGQDFITSVPLGEIAGTVFTTFEAAEGNYKYWVVLVDTSNIASTPASIEVAVEGTGDSVDVKVEVVSGGVVFRNNQGAPKIVKANVHIGGVLKSDANHEGYMYRWLNNGQLVYADVLGNYVQLEPGTGYYPADPGSPNGLNFRSLIVEATDVLDSDKLTLTVEVSNIP